MDLSRVRALSFDCAETLVRTRWVPGEFALDCAAEAGVNLEGTPARETYDRLLGTRWRDYQEVNRRRDPDACVSWWAELTADWLHALHLPREHLSDILLAADRLLYGPDHRYFELFPDVVPALEGLARRGLPMVVVSNWDYSLPRVLKSLGLSDQFQAILASMVEGYEKPDARLFDLALGLLDLDPDQVLHIGDNPVDDVQGARNAGMHALLIDRAAKTNSPGVIGSLLELEPRITGGH